MGLPKKQRRHFTSTVKELLGRLLPDTSPPKKELDTVLKKSAKMKVYSGIKNRDIYHGYK